MGTNLTRREAILSALACLGSPVLPEALPERLPMFSAGGPIPADMAITLRPGENVISAQAARRLGSLQWKDGVEVRHVYSHRTFGRLL